jgi:hypothetical protein
VTNSSAQFCLSVCGKMLACLILFSELMGVSARAEGEAFCRDYAQRAVDAFRQNESLRCGFANARWQPNFDNHFGWCRGVPAIWTQQEDKSRENQLRVCRREPKAFQCNEYAINANGAHRSNLSGGCGFSGARWQDNYDAHLAWCISAPAELVNHESNVRFAMLGICGRQQPFVRCDEYARRAAAQVAEANRRQCGFGGPRWTPSYDNHLSWCIGVPEDFAASEAREREGPLSQCRTTNPEGPPPPAPEACAVSVIVKNEACLSLDGTPSSMSPGSASQPGCGADQGVASQRAKLAFSANVACITEGDSPSPGCCTVNEQLVPGCLCH